MMGKLMLAGDLCPIASFIISLACMASLLSNNFMPDIEILCKYNTISFNVCVCVFFMLLSFAMHGGTVYVRE